MLRETELPRDTDPVPALPRETADPVEDVLVVLRVTLLTELADERVALADDLVALADERFATAVAGERPTYEDEVLLATLDGRAADPLRYDPLRDAPPRAENPPSL